MEERSRRREDEARSRRLSRRAQAVRASRRPRNPGYPTRKQEPLRLRTPSPEQQRRRVSVLDRADRADREALPAIVSDLQEVRENRAHRKDMEKQKYAQRFTDLPTPVIRPPPKGMPTLSEDVRRVLDRRARERGSTLDPRSIQATLDVRWLFREFDAPGVVSARCGTRR